MTDGSSTSLIDNPLRGEPVASEEPPQSAQAPAAPPPAPTPAGTSFFIVGGLDLGCGLYFDAPLTDDETTALKAALEPVLAKYRVPNIPLAEELQLVATLAAIIVPRVKVRIEQRRAEEAAANEGNAGDTPIVRQEGVREINSAPRVGSESLGFAATGEAADMVP